MANQPQAEAAGSPPTAQLVGNAFVHQYYNILYQSPELVYRFYQDSSRLGRPEPEGAMDSVTTMQAINNKIMSTDYGGLRAEIITVDAQESLNNGVLVLVTGYLIGKDNVRRKFTQSFFLATQDKGYFVLNDIFRYVEEFIQQGNQDVPNGTVAPLAVAQEAPPPSEDYAPECLEPPQEEEEVTEDVCKPSEHDTLVEVDASHSEVVVEDPNIPRAVTADSGSSTNLEEAPKKSYASILKVMKENVVPSPAPALAPLKTAPPKLERQATPAIIPTPVPETSALSSNVLESVPESEVDGHSIYIKGLPLNATPAQLEEEFKRFGVIKPGGIQVRSHKQQGICFGFIDFETASSVQSAIEASPLHIGGCQVLVEEKRPAGSRVSSRGRFSGRMGGFRSEGPRGRGSFGGGRGYARGDFSSIPEYGGRGSGRRGGSSRGDGGVYQRVDTGNTGGRGTRGASGAPRDASPRVPAPA